MSKKHIGNTSRKEVTTQLTFTFLKSTMKTPKQCVKSVQN